MRWPICSSLAVLASLLAPQLAHAEAPTRVWVFFTDHGRSDAQIEAELARRRTELGPRTLARRAKVRAGALLDAYDLLPAARYVQQLEQHGAAIRVQSRWLNAVSIEADAELQAQLAALPFVRGLHPVAAADPQPFELQPAPLPANPDDYGLSWAQLELLGVPALHDCGLTGAGVIVAVQDTGFALDHQAFVNADVLATHDFINEDDDVGIEMGDDLMQHWHGTLVLSSIIGDDAGSYRGAAPGVSVILSKTEDVVVEQAWEEDAYVAGLEWIESMGADIFTASLGYRDWYTLADLDGATAVTTVAIEAAVGNGLIVFTSMGNDGPNPSTIAAPADAAGAISLGATDMMGNLAGFSSRGPTGDGRIKPDVVAPGVDIAVADPFDPQGYIHVNGTSLSTPIAAGVGALLLEAYPWLTPADMAELLRSTAAQADSPDNDHGYGLIDALAAAELYCNCADLDGDQFFDAACGGDDCDDGDPTRYPGAAELCDGLDNDCDGELLGEELDADQDGHYACDDDCDDDNEAIYAGATELCDNGIDDDCDELVDALDPDCMPTGDGDGDPGDGDGDGGSASDTGEATTGETGSGDDDPGAETQSGCACAATRQPRPFAALGLLAGLLLVRRRRSAC